MKIILASKSPRRQELLRLIGLEFTVKTKEIKEIYPSDLICNDIPEFLAKLKAEPFRVDLKNDELLITSDTVVVQNGKVLGKPKNTSEARQMLSSLSNNCHQVLTAVCISTSVKQYCFTTSTAVYFDQLSPEEIDYYIDNYQPFDKAGSYGIQEWIGAIGVKKIDGCYYNVMGLPLRDLKKALKEQFNYSLTR